MDQTTSISLLNKAVADELTAIHQYMYFHFHLADQGFQPLAVLFKMTAIREMTHVETLAERVLFLGGDVEMRTLAAVECITDAADMLAKAAQMEQESARDYNRAALECSANSDSATKQLFERLVADEEGHYDEFNRQMEHIRRFGLSYLALQSFQKPETKAAAAE